jgi:hypothetical protein
MVEAPILNIMLLAALYLPAPDGGVFVSVPEPITDFLVQKPASTWPDRREVARRAVNGDGKVKKPRIVKMRGGIKEKKKRQQNLSGVVSQTSVWRHQVSVSHVWENSAMDLHLGINGHP